MASFEAAKGIVMFGWTSVIVISAVSTVYFKEKNYNILDKKV